jgi:pimeloyl-ACP methyl ester carboxylesterase
VSTYLLVHGAFHGGWCWRDVAKRLRSDGHDVFTPTLTGLGDRAHQLSPTTTLDTHIEDICGVINSVRLYDVVMVAHSYAGLPVTGAADRRHNRIRALVYIDAVVPEDGDTGESVRGPEASGSLRRVAEGLTVPAPPASYFGLSGDSETWVDEKTTPHPYQTLTQPIALSGEWLRVPRKLFVRTRSFKAPYLDRYLERAKSDPEWRTVECDEIHDMMIANPNYVAGLLMADEVCGAL